MIDPLLGEISKKHNFINIIYAYSDNIISLTFDKIYHPKIRNELKRKNFFNYFLMILLKKLQNKQYTLIFQI
jgi:hypothetical protein